MSNIINIQSNLTPRHKNDTTLLSIATHHGIQEANIKIDPATQLHTLK